MTKIKKLLLGEYGCYNNGICCGIGLTPEKAIKNAEKYLKENKERKTK